MVCEEERMFVEPEGNVSRNLGLMYIGSESATVIVRLSPRQGK